MHVVPESKWRKIRTFPFRGSLQSGGKWFWGPFIRDPGSFGDPSFRPINVYYLSCVVGQQTWKEFVRDDGLVVKTTDVDLSRTHGEIKGLPAITSEAHVQLRDGHWVRLSLLSEEDEEKRMKYSFGRLDPPYRLMGHWQIPRGVMSVVPRKTYGITEDGTEVNGLK